MRLHTLRGVASVPAVQALALSGVLWLAIFVYCNFALWRDPHGAYFHSEHVDDLDYSLVRREEARAFLKQYADLDPRTRQQSLPPASSSSATSTSPLFDGSPQRAGSHPALCAAVITSRRDYSEEAASFSDSVGSMLAGLSPAERAALHLRVLFANSVAPDVHPDFKAPWVGALVDHAAGYEGYTDDDIDELRFREGTGDFPTKGMHDYAYVLEACYNQTRAPFVAVFDDDIIFAGDWFARTLRGLQHLSAAAPEQRQGWLSLRLFYTETFMKWDAETDWWYGHMFLTMALVEISFS